MAAGKLSSAPFAMPSAQTSFGRRVRADMSDPKRLEAFAALKDSLSDVWQEDFNDDLYLYRFFKARDFEAIKAGEMVRNHLRWRKEFRADELLVEGFQEPEVVARFYPGGFCGRDNEGFPVWYEASGLIDPQGMAKSVPRDVLLRSRVFICEKFMRQILPDLRRSTGQPLYSCSFVIDLQNLGRRHLWGPGLEFITEFLRLCEQNYPETIGIAFVVNAPSIFPIVFNIIRPLLHAETQKKIKVLGKNYTEILLNAIDADQLPKVYGGSKTDPDGDPRCPSLICWGGDVPKEFYLRPNYPDRLVSQAIGRRSKFRVDLSVPAAGSEGLCIEWDFFTEDGDLGFEIVGENPDREPLVGYRRVHCGICPCSGAVSCAQQPGTYIVCFDNSFSWVHTKRLKYFVHVTDRPFARLIDDCRGVSSEAAASAEGESAAEASAEFEMASGTQADGASADSID